MPGSDKEKYEACTQGTGHCWRSISRRGKMQPVDLVPSSKLPTYYVADLPGVLKCFSLGNWKERVGV